MLERIVADVLVRVLGSYVDGLNKESIRVGVWRGDLELRNLRLRPDALAVLFESLGLDLPVTVTAGYIGLLRLEVPWKSLRSAPVRIFMHDLTIVASPVSDGDQSALELRDKRLKAARLATDEALRDAKFSVRSLSDNAGVSSTTFMIGDHSSDMPAESADVQSQSGSRVARWGWRFTSRIVTKIVDNIQLDVENVIVQYEDASSVRDRPYTATLALDSLRACSTDHTWTPVFIEDPSSPIVHKVVYMRGLVLNWEPGNANNDLKAWVLNGSEERTSGEWSGFVRKCTRHAIQPLDGELRIALTKSSALTAALAGKDPSLLDLKSIPRVQMDLHFPDVRIVLDDFQYHTLLSTIMYLSDIDRKVRPRTAKGRWLWALDRLLPRFKVRRDALLRFNAEGLKKRRETREKYCRARNVLVNARRKGAAEPAEEAKVVADLEEELSYDDVILFRDLADIQLYEALRSGTPGTASSSRLWSLFSLGSRDISSREASRSRDRSGPGTPKRSRSPEARQSYPRSKSGDSLLTADSMWESNIDSSEAIVDPNGESLPSEAFDNSGGSVGDVPIPNFRMGFLLGRGAIELKHGGFPDPPTSAASLEFRELRLGIETRPGAGFLLEALLGTFEVVDLQKDMKVMYPRVPWAGNEAHDTKDSASALSDSSDAQETPTGVLDGLAEKWIHQQQPSSSVVPSVSFQTPSEGSVHSAVLHSYPHEISNAIYEIRGEYGLKESPLPPVSPKFPRRSPYSCGMGSESSSGSLSGLSDGISPGVSMYNREDLSIAPQTPLKYIAALRLNQEEAPAGEWARGATRMAMDLAIGGMEVLVDGPRGAFISAVTFWHPREKMPSIMQFLFRAAAPRLASLRMDIQKAILERSVPMRMDILIRGPRFVVPGHPRSEISLVLDLGTFAMETSTGSPILVEPDAHQDSSVTSAAGSAKSEMLSVRYTDYRMAASDLGLYVVSEAGKQAAERIIRPFSVHLLLQVLHNSAFVEAMTLHHGKVDIAKVKLLTQLPSLRTSVSHDAFRQLLSIVQGWGARSERSLAKSGIEPNKVVHSVTMSAELEERRITREIEQVKQREKLSRHRSPLVSFEMSLDFEDLQLELRDSQARRVVTINTSGTSANMKRRTDVIDFDFKVRTFTVTDGSRGATAPFRRLAYAGTERTSAQRNDDVAEDPFASEDQRTFITLAYHGDLINHEQSLGIKILSLHLVCVRETYFALADFFYLNEAMPSPSPPEKAGPSSALEWSDVQTVSDGCANDKCEDVGNGDAADAGYSDPFAALGMTTSGAARALREQAERGMELSKQALADRGKLSVTADLDGMNLTLVTAEGAIACFDVSDCKVKLTHFATGAVTASGELGSFGIRDLTSAYDVYSETIRYSRAASQAVGETNADADGWALTVPESRQGDVWLEARLRNIRIVYLQRFIVILKKYFDVMRESLKPVLEMKGGIAEVFSEVRGDDLAAMLPAEGRVRLNVITENVDVVMPRHSQSPYEALRFFVPRSSITNEDHPAPGYQVGFQIEAAGVDAHVLYQPPAAGEGRALTPGGTQPVLRQISPNSPVADLVPFAENICIVAKLDAWRRRKVPEVVLNADGIPVLKDGEEEMEYDPAKWLPTIRVRVSAPEGISARLCEAEYSILYFTFTENIIERPDIEFTDIVRGLKTPILPARKPVQPIMFSSNRMPPNYQIRFEVPRIDSVIMSGGNPRDTSERLIRSELRDLVGCFEYGVDYRMTIEVSANMHSLEDARPRARTHGMKLIMPTKKMESASPFVDQSDFEGHEMSRSVTLTWDRPFGFRANVMVVVSDLRIIVEPELFRDLGALTAPGFPFLKSSAPPPLLRFNGRLLILTISRPEIWLMANQYPGDGSSLVIRGDVIAKVQWAPVTGRNVVEVAANGIRVNLSNTGPLNRTPVSPLSRVMSEKRSSLGNGGQGNSETPMLYPSDVSLKFEGRGYDPPENPGDEPVKAPGSNLYINAESFLVRLDVNDTPLILGVGSRLVRLKPSALSRRPVQPGRFDQWIDNGDDGDAKLSVHFALPQSRLMFTDETTGRYVPIMEARIRNAVLRSNVPWLTNAAFKFALDLFNEEKGWWEPGIEDFPIEIAASKGRSGSQAIHIRAERNIDLNVTPNTVSGAARVSKALKAAIEDLKTRLQEEDASTIRAAGGPFPNILSLSGNFISASASRRPSLAAFCVRNETGRPMVMWLPYDTKRRSLRGNGGEIEIDTPSEELLWTAMGATGGISSDPNRNRRISMSCVLSLSGYESVTLSAEQTGSRLVTLVPDNREVSSPAAGHRSLLSTLTLVWAVTMRDGVPCGCIRSVLRLVNRTRTVLEVNIGGLTKSASAGAELSGEAARSGRDVDRQAHGVVKAGESWSIPIHAVNRAIRVRPALFRAPESEDDVREDKLDPFPAKGRVYYSYKWSDPLSKVSALHDIGMRLGSKVKADGSYSKTTLATGPRTPILACKSEDSRGVFCLAIHPKIDTSLASQPRSNDESHGWVDVHMCPPLVFENLLPRPVSFKLAKPGQFRKIGKEQIFAQGYIEPLREFHIHGMGSDLEAVAVAMGMDNSPEAPKNWSIGTRRPAPTRTVGEYQPGLPTVRKISTGYGRYTPFRVSLNHEQTLSTRFVRMFCEFWIRNRSDTDLFFRDKEHSRDSQGTNPKVFLGGSPPGTIANSFICFSGRWLSFQRADTTEDVWVNLGTEVSEIDKPIHIGFDGLSLVLDVRPAKGQFHRTLVVTIRNAVWFENRTGSVLQWCQPSALNPHGIALSSKVHTVRPGKCIALHWDFRSQKKAVCLRRANENGSSDWIWSRPVGVEGLEGEFAAKMYRPKRHEQYIARVVVSKLGNGVSAIVVHKEDRNTPPYKIVNLCAERSIAFRQSGVNETHPWLVRPGRTTRYSWDDPQAPVKRRSLIIEVIETHENASSLSSRSSTSKPQIARAESMTSELSEMAQGPSFSKREKEIRYPKFELNIDMIRDRVPFSHSKRFNPELIVSVRVDGPTKVVTFVDKRDDEEEQGSDLERAVANGQERSLSDAERRSPVILREGAGNLDVELFVNSLGVSFVESTPSELAYLSVTGVHFRLDRFDGQQLIVCEVQDVQLDNQLVHCTWPVVLWSPPPPDQGSGKPHVHVSSSQSPERSSNRKPFFQFTIDGQYPSMKQGIGSFRGIFVALQQLQIAADEDFVLRVWLFVVSLIEAAGGTNKEKEESLHGKDGLEKGISTISSKDAMPKTEVSGDPTEDSGQALLNRLYVEHLELCPLKLCISFTSSRTSTAAEHIGGFRSLIRTLVAVLGNVENAEFRFNALQLQHVFDTTSHFRSLIAEYYISQGSNQKIVLLASNSLIGNPSALFDSIAIGTRDFFVEPANAKGSADFIASIGRGSSSLLTNTVGGLVGSLGGIPRAVAQGLETAVGDREYLAERDSIRGGRARIVSSPAQGLFTGALSFGHGIASGAAGLIRDPIQGAAEEGPSGFIKGLGKGFIGGVLKPITGALDLIAEPAAGLRCMMVSERNRDSAEPARPPRAFWGVNGDRMVSYDLRSALGQAILEVVNRGDSEQADERLLSWTHLVAIHSSATEEDVISFLWALMRRSTRSSHFQSKYLLDAQGNPQRAEKMRAGLISNKRMVVTSLEGHVLWEHPLVDIVDTQVSLEAKDYLMVGVRPVGHTSKAIITPSWKKIHCGSMTSRDELNSILRKALEDLRALTEVLPTSATTELTTPETKAIPLKEIRRDHRRDASVEMVDMSVVVDANGRAENMLEMKSLHHDATVDGRRGVFTDMKLPGRNESEVRMSLQESGTLLSISQKLATMMGKPSRRQAGAVRSVRIFLVNDCSTRWRLSDASLDSGAWATRAPKVVEPNSVIVVEADGTMNRVTDVSGAMLFCSEEQRDPTIEELLAVRFLNPMLAANAYAVQVPPGYTVTRAGGEKGDHVSTTISIKRAATANEVRDDSESAKRRSRTVAEPLLFGRSKVTPYLPPITFSPPHGPKPQAQDPNDPKLVANLASLGFSSVEARAALNESGADLSKAYSILIERRKGL